VPPPLPIDSPSGRSSVASMMTAALTCPTGSSSVEMDSNGKSRRSEDIRTGPVGSGSTIASSSSARATGLKTSRVEMKATDRMGASCGAARVLAKNNAPPPPQNPK
jgi:hypothetical protein